MDSDWEHWRSEGGINCFVKKFDDFRGFVVRVEKELEESIVHIQSKMPIWDYEEAKSKAETAAEMLRGWK